MIQDEKSQVEVYKLEIEKLKRKADTQISELVKLIIDIEN